MEIAAATPRDGHVLVGTQTQPLIVTATRGRGQITLFNFNPELKPFLEWKNRHHFWAKIVGMPPELLQKNSTYSRAYQSIDGVFGAMVDSRQIRKLPVGWLLLILVAYLLVIGPLDRYWLKKINRQMLTWLTFPAYVAMFSLLIYFIGYKLRAGDTEWNELHLVDILPGSPSSQSRLHGLTYGSLYSPANARYTLAFEKPFAAFRGEYSTSDSGRSAIQYKGDGFMASAAVPVWTSQLFATRWWRDQDTPLLATLTGDSTNITATMVNQLDVDLANVRLIHDGLIHDLGSIAAGKTGSFQLNGSGSNLESFVQVASGEFDDAINARRNPLGANSWNQIQNFTNAAIAACFLQQSGNRKFLAPPGLDLSPDLDRGNAILLAWTTRYAPIEPLNQFAPRRHHRETLWRLVIPKEQKTSL
jgi:hypothetical protein